VKNKLLISCYIFGGGEGGRYTEKSRVEGEGSIYRKGGGRYIRSHSSGSQIQECGSINTISLFFIDFGLARQAFCLLGVCFQALARFLHRIRTLSMHTERLTLAI